ncbi:DUF5330 domain-containing protein [Microbaculum marinum]|uniref:DUF5330 domain-containing protein n=1 Tax=Microbaculum marinum TaxID=1764581 RepID=A0AAW9RM49_9HYPH
MFLIRTAFWLFLVVMLIPTGQSGQDGEPAETDLSPMEALSAAQHTVSDLAGFCDRNPATCETGTAVAKTFGQKAQAGAKMLYDYLSKTDFGSGAGTAATAGSDGADTLSTTDRDIPWQGPDAQG